MIIDTSFPTTNFTARVANQSINYLVLHYTAVDFQTSLDLLTRSGSPNRVSAHYLIKEDGHIYQLARQDQVTWHAGVSKWKNVDGLNQCSIGVELVHPGHGPHYGPFPKKQLDALIRLCLPIIEQHCIPAANILAHSDIAVGRKRDPGEMMNWQYLADNGLGIMPPHDIDCSSSDKTLADQLRLFGYHSSCDQAILDAFAMHWGGPDTQTWSNKIKWLIKPYLK